MRRNIRLERKSVGLCTSCGLYDAINKADTCEICTLKRFSVRHFRTQTHWAALAEKLLQQDQKCAVTGVPISLGDNASLDHIVPRSKSGENTLENTQWVHIWVNIMKGASDEQDFLREFVDFQKRIFTLLKRNEETNPAKLLHFLNQSASKAV